MATKMKGLLKGLRYISQIFDEEKEDDIQIGFPTDVKHVAHIGWDDGPKSVNNDSPGWMDDFKSSSKTEVFQSAPLGPCPEPSSNGSSKSSDKNDPHVKWVSEDSKRSSRRATGSSNKDELPKSSRRHSMNTNNDSNEESSSPKKKDPSSKPRQSRRHKEGPPPQDLTTTTTTTSTTTCSQQVPADIPRKSRRKKSKEEGGSTRSRSKPTNDTSYDPDPAPVVLPKPNDDDLDYPRQSRVTFKDC